MNKRTTAALAAVAAFFLSMGAVACEETSVSTDKGSSSSSEAKGGEEKQSTVDAFKEFVEKNGTAEEKAAVAHVRKVQGAESQNDILDAPEIHTDIKGDLMNSEATGSAKLISSAFAEFQADRGKSSKNGLVTVYNASGDMIGNGKV